MTYKNANKYCWYPKTTHTHLYIYYSWHVFIMLFLYLLTTHCWIISSYNHDCVMSFSVKRIESLGRFSSSMANQSFFFLSFIHSLEKFLIVSYLVTSDYSIFLRLLPTSHVWAGGFRRFFYSPATDSIHFKPCSSSTISLLLARGTKGPILLSTEPLALQFCVLTTVAWGLSMVGGGIFLDAIPIPGQ